jgi:hypothetical protein
VVLVRRCVCWPGLPVARRFHQNVHHLPARGCTSRRSIRRPLAGPVSLLFPIPVPTRLGGCISLDFLELPVYRSGHDFLQVHIESSTS